MLHDARPLPHILAAGPGSEYRCFRNMRRLVDHLHTPVAKRARIITPTEHALDIVAVDKNIAEKLQPLRAVIELFLKNPEPPTWVPANSVKSDNCDFIASLKIPSYRNGHPSLLLHDLDVCDDKKITEIFGQSEPLYVVINCYGAVKPSYHELQVHLQHLRIWKNPAHAGRSYEVLGVLLCCNSGYQRCWCPRYGVCLG